MATHRAYLNMQDIVCRSLLNAADCSGVLNIPRQTLYRKLGVDYPKAMRYQTGLLPYWLVSWFRVRNSVVSSIPDRTTTPIVKAVMALSACGRRVRNSRELSAILVRSSDSIRSATQFGVYSFQ